MHMHMHPKINIECRLNLCTIMRTIHKICLFESEYFIRMK